MDKTEIPLLVVPRRKEPIGDNMAGRQAVSCDLVKTKRYESVNEFLSDISYGGEMYTKMNGMFVYRGLQSGTYQLIPSALRHKIRFKNQDGTDYVEDENDEIQMADSELNQRSVEYYNLRTFFEICDSNTLRLPNVDRMRKYLLTYKEMNFTRMRTDEWIPYDLQELAALAQHYGMETRLLDWTSSVETAIYFACHKEPLLQEDEKQKEDARFVVIWMLDTSVEYKSASLRFIRPPYYGNPNLAAQKGLFTYWREPGFVISSNVISEEEQIDHLRVRVNRKPLDVRLKEELGDTTIQSTFMWKLMIPREGRRELFDYISRKGVSAASLFPGYAGVVESIKEWKEIMH